MKAAQFLAIASLAAAASFGAHADEADASQYAVQFQGTLTRAQVQAELAQNTGTSPWSTQYNPLAQFKSNRSRAEVQGEYLASRDEVAALNSEDSGSASLTQLAGRGVSRNVRLAGQPSQSAQ